MGAAPAAVPNGRRGPDRVGLVLGAVMAAAVAFEPFVTFRPNRIASGKGLALWAALPPGAASCGLALIGVTLVATTLRVPAAWRAAAVGAALLGLVGIIGRVPAHLVPPGNTVARVSPAGGFWLLVLALSLLAADTLAKARPGPLLRLGALAAAVALTGLALASGTLDGLSPLKEYAAHADTFWREALKHVELAFGSLAAAIVAGIPLGIACARRPGLRGVAIPALNIVQTVPSIAMYGLMMVPLGLLATRFPVLGAMGIRGIGTAPAVTALFLYSLLPVVANTAIGLDGVPATAREAARGMGMSDGQRLRQVELPLAMPVILTGIRVVLVQNIGLVTVAALIGGGGLGTFVFQGIGQSAIDLVLLGAVPIIGIAFAAAVALDAAVDLAGSATA